MIRNHISCHSVKTHITHCCSAKCLLMGVMIDCLRSSGSLSPRSIRSRGAKEPVAHFPNSPKLYSCMQLQITIKTRFVCTGQTYAETKGREAVLGLPLYALTFKSPTCGAPVGAQYTVYPEHRPGRPFGYWWKRCGLLTSTSSSNKTFETMTLRSNTERFSDIALECSRKCRREAEWQLQVSSCRCLLIRLQRLEGLQGTSG